MTLNETFDTFESFENEDSVAPFDEYTTFEFDLDNKLNTVYNFKQLISKEPEFCGINSLSSFDILQVFQNPDNVKLKNYFLTFDQFYIIKSFYWKIFKTLPKDIYIDKIGVAIMDKIYIN